MRATVMFGAGDVRIETVPDARLIEPTDALVAVSRAAICGSDLWPYNPMEHGDDRPPDGPRVHRRRRGRRRRRPHVHVRRPGRRAVLLLRRHVRLLPRRAAHVLPPRRRSTATDGVDGGQGEAVRVPQADGTLVVLPVGQDDALMPSLLTLSDVMATGHHAALAAKVGPGKTVAVVGDGAVGLCGVIAARRLGAEQIIILGRHADRIALAREFGATDVVSERGDEAVERVRELTGGLGAHSVLECVGHERVDGRRLSPSLGRAAPSGASACRRTRRSRQPCRRSSTTSRSSGGPAPARAYIEELLPDVLEGRIEPGRVFDRVGAARRRAGRLPRDERPRGDQGDGDALRPPGCSQAAAEGRRIARSFATLGVPSIRGDEV